MDEKELAGMSLEESFQLLEEIIAKMESREISLEESFQKYQEGMLLLKSCNEKIDRVEKNMLILNENGEVNEF
ncbi:MAG: exodeoxyribonuclease VII small subunit [Eubacteriales bacterium]|nr:exodeoxyribonuclease VII small subunit [Eubacteriales bacterium]